MESELDKYRRLVLSASWFLNGTEFQAKIISYYFMQVTVFLSGIKENK